LFRLIPSQPGSRVEERFPLQTKVLFGRKPKIVQYLEACSCLKLFHKPVRVALCSGRGGRRRAPVEDQSEGSISHFQPGQTSMRPVFCFLRCTTDSLQRRTSSLVCNRFKLFLSNSAPNLDGLHESMPAVADAEEARQERQDECPIVALLSICRVLLLVLDSSASITKACASV